MKKLFISFLFLHLSISTLITTEPATPLFLQIQRNCAKTSSSFLSIRSTPSQNSYKNVNFQRDPTFLDPLNTIFLAGDSSKYELEKSSCGHGLNGQVFKAINIENNQVYALKVVHDHQEKNYRELQVLLDLKNCPNLCVLRDVLVDEAKFKAPFTFVFDYFDYKPLSEFSKNLNKYTMKRLIYETLKGLDYIHSQGIMHRDIKHENVLMNPETYEVRIIDLGQAEYYLPNKHNHFVTHSVGTLHYRAPEHFLKYHAHDYAVDLWSVGVMLGEMMFQKVFLFETDRKHDWTGMHSAQQRPILDRDQIDAIAKTMGTAGLLQYAEKFKDHMSLRVLEFVEEHPLVPWRKLVNEGNVHLVDGSGIDLLSKLLVYDHTQRLTAKEAMDHCYFKGIRKEVENL